jgi:chaperonin GroES
MKIKPFPNYCVAKPILLETQTKSGIIIARSEKKEMENSQYGTVVAVSYTKEDDENLRKNEKIFPGDRILYGQYAGIEVELENQKYRLIELRDVRAKVID